MKDFYLCPKFFKTIRNYTLAQFLQDAVAGLIVAVIALPLSIALALASGVAPACGVYTAIAAGFIVALLGGSRVQIAGPTAAFATIVAGVVATQGMDGLFIATVIAGILLILMGVLKLGSLIRFIPQTITVGFTAGIAVTIFIGQIKDFLGLTFAPGVSPVEAPEKLEAILHSIGTINWWALLVGAFGLAILIVWPKISKKIPGSLIAVLLGSGLVILLQQFGIEVLTIEKVFHLAEKENLALSFNLPFADFDWSLIPELLPSAATIAILASIESLLSCVVSDEMIGDRHNSNTELIAQGLGNICSGFFRGIPATGAIARTAANVKNGGTSPVSGIVHAIVLLLVLLFLMPFAGYIPMPIIAAVLFMVAYNMSEWRHFVKICKTAPLTDIVVLVATFALTVIFDLVVAIAVGMVLAVVFFMKNMADVTHIRVWNDDEYLASHDNQKLKDIPDNVAVLEIEGPIFFASSDKFRSLPVKEDVKIIILRMRDVPMLDNGGCKNLSAILADCQKKGQTLLLSHPNEQPLKALKKSGFVDAIGEENILSNIDQALEYAEKLLK